MFSDLFNGNTHFGNSNEYIVGNSASVANETISNKKKILKLNGSVIVPVTRLDCVYSNKGESLDSIIENFVTKNYVDDKFVDVNAVTLNGYSLWVGTTEDLEKIENRDENTLYLKINDTNEDYAEVTEEDKENWNNKQDKEDENLNTNDKTIVGAINELDYDVFSVNSEIIELNISKADKSELFSGDYNDLENKPVYDTRTIENVVLEIDKDMDLSNYETKDMLIIPDESYYFKLVKLRPAYPGDIDNMKESGTLTNGEDTIPIKQVIEIDPEINYFGVIFEFLIIVERDEFNDFPGGPIESGIWMIHSAYIIDENGEHVEQDNDVELYDGMIIRYDSLSGELRQLDEKFLPNLVGECTTGKTFTVYDNIEDMANNTNGISAVARANAEIFNSKDNVAVGSYSHAEGQVTIASGSAAHAEGQVTIANGYAAHAEGQGTIASGSVAHAEGQGTIASGENQHVQGKFNIEDTEDKYAHIVGGGRQWKKIVDGETISIIEPKNIHTLDWNGNAWFQGNVSIDGTPTNNNDLVTKKYVDDNKFSGSYNDLTNKPEIPSIEGLASETYVNNTVAGLVDSAPETLNTLNELAQALGDDPNFATTVSTEIGKKANSADLATVATSGSYNDLTDRPNLSSINALQLNGYSLWVGTTEQLNQIEDRDEKTIYMEIGNTEDNQTINIDADEIITNIFGSEYIPN